MIVSQKPTNGLGVRMPYIFVTQHGPQKQAVVFFITILVLAATLGSHK